MPRDNLFADKTLLAFETQRKLKIVGENITSISSHLHPGDWGLCVWRALHMSRLTACKHKWHFPKEECVQSSSGFLDLASYQVAALDSRPSRPQVRVLLHCQLQQQKVLFGFPTAFWMYLRMLPGYLVFRSMLSDSQKTILILGEFKIHFQNITITTNSFNSPWHKLMTRPWWWCPACECHWRSSPPTKTAGTLKLTHV